ncbi:hypothetical protein F5B20DRAFT_521027 [Whalleya microplaca]|nr:hypothetical protein F5B20DRAFT_521027 [Whalleya microplaca]
MERLPGENYITARGSLTRDQQMETLYSLAKFVETALLPLSLNINPADMKCNFFAQSWQRAMPVDSNMVDMSAISAECYTKFEYLSSGLPERFLPAVAEGRAGLAALLDGSYPVVLTHGDLNETEILVNPRSGKITGVVDWADSSIQPFGFALYALENALGSMGPRGWEWFDNVEALRSAFWGAFQDQTGLSEPQRRLVELAGKAGILIRYGMVYESGVPGMRRVRGSNEEDFRYLDALLL